MKYYFCVKFIRNTDYPNGRKMLETYIAAETKAEAKVRAFKYFLRAGWGMRFVLQGPVSRGRH